MKELSIDRHLWYEVQRFQRQGWNRFALSQMKFYKSEGEHKWILIRTFFTYSLRVKQVLSEIIQNKAKSIAFF